MLLRRPYRIAIGQNVWQLRETTQYIETKTLLLIVFILSETELHNAKHKNVFMHRVVSDFALKQKKQKQNVFVSVSFLWFGSETKTKCFCFTQFTMILHWNKNKMFLFRSVSVIWQWNKNKMSLHLFWPCWHSIQSRISRSMILDDQFVELILTGYL